MAQDELHGRRTLSGMHHPIQMKPADNEKKNVEDRKLFIGMISKKFCENDIRSMFNQFGSIEDCMILRDTSGVSRGCAFVTFAVRQSAVNAIQHMHHSSTMEGCSSPLVVKFADTQKDKDSKTKLLPGNNNIIHTSPFPTAGLASLPPNYLSLFQQSLSPNGMNLTGLQNGMPNLTDITAFQNIHNLQGFQGLQNMAYIGQNAGLYNNQSLLGLPAIATSSLPSARTLASPTTGNSLPLSSMAGLTSSPTTSGTNLSGAATLGNGSVSLTGSMPLTGAVSLQPPNQATPLTNQTAVDAALTQAYNGIAQYTASFPHAYAPVSTTLPAESPAGKQTEGPDGANLFIYHLPQEFLDHDLLNAFMPFGNVVSAKVFIDKQTNLSKCFGFVSFDNPLSAQAAIATMNGFQIGMKRLKVQLKRPKNESKPY